MNKHGSKVVCKIPLSPKLLKHVYILIILNVIIKLFKKAFGEGQLVQWNDNVATREYSFEDNNLDLFLLYDYKATTDYHGENLLDYDYSVIFFLYIKDGF